MIQDRAFFENKLFITKKRATSVVTVITILFSINLYLSFKYLNSWSILIQNIVYQSNSTDIWISFVLLTLLYLFFKVIYLIPLYYTYELVHKENELFNYNMYMSIPQNEISNKEMMGKYSADHRDISYILLYALNIMVSLPDVLAILILSFMNLFIFVLLIILYLFFLGIIFLGSTYYRTKIQTDLSKQRAFITGEFTTLIEKIRPIKMIKNYNFIEPVKDAQDKRSKLNSNVVFMNGLVHPYSIQILLYVFLIVYVLFFKFESKILIAIVGSFIITLPYLTSLTSSFFESLPLILRINQQYLPLTRSFSLNAKKQNYTLFDFNSGEYNVTITHNHTYNQYKLTPSENIIFIPIQENEFFDFEQTINNNVKINDKFNNECIYKIYPTETHLLNEDIYKNIALSSENEINYKLADHALKIACIDFSVNKDIIFQGGSNLSGGEKSRIKIARIIYDNLKNINGFNLLFNPFRGIDNDLQEEILSNLRKEKLCLLIFENSNKQNYIRG